MCGFLVTLGYDGPLDHHKLGALKRRGPDGLGVWAEGPVRMVQARLAVIDPDERSLGPLVNDEWAMVFNGEIYNYAELSPGAHGDGAALLAWWTRNKGNRNCLSECRGFYAAVFYHRATKRIVCVRDCAGIRPLYTMRGKDFVAAASALGVLRDNLPGPLTLDNEGLSQYARYQLTWDGRTFFREVRRVEPGDIWSFTTDATGHARLPDPWGMQDPFEPVEPKIVEVVRESLMADRHVVTTCSGGLDSSLVTALAKPDLAFHANYNNPRCNETRWAKMVPGPHRLFVTNLEEEPNLLARLDSLVEDFSDPCVGSVILPLDELFRAIRPRAQVVLTGTGGDELFGGYVRYSLADGRPEGDDAYAGEWRKIEHLSPPERCKTLLTKGDPSLFSFFQEPELEITSARELVDFDRRVFLPALCTLEDAIAGRHGIETRPALLHPWIVRYAMNVDALEAPRKNHLRALARGILPDELIDRPDKVGFATPLGRWIESQWHAIVERLHDSKFRHMYRLENLRKPTQLWDRRVWGLLMLDAWLNRYA